MVVQPAPVVLPVCTPQPPVLYVRAMGFDNPAVVIGDLNIIPNVIVAVIGIVSTIAHTDSAAGRNYNRSDSY